jgi:hypothetical protein
MSDWKLVGIYCDHCGKELECKPVYEGLSIVILGFEPMQYRHGYDKSVECKVTTIDNAHPYSDCGIRTKYNKQMID